MYIMYVYIVDVCKYRLYGTQITYRNAAPGQLCASGSAITAPFSLVQLALGSKHLQ